MRCTVRFVEIWGRSTRARPGADAIDAQRHAERVEPKTRGQLHHQAALDELPNGSFVLHQGAPHLVLGSDLLRWTAAGYLDRVPRLPRQRATLITPPSLVAVLRTGWEERLVPLVHPSAAR